jgi:putative ABC transport system permease protein
MGMDRLVQDLRIALRGLRRSPTFAVATVLILGLGIGMAVAMFTTVHAILLRRLPVQDQDRLAVFWTYQVPTVEYAPTAVMLPDIQRASRSVHALAGIVHWGVDELPLLDGDQTVLLRGLGVTANYFDVLGVRAVLGRSLRPEDAAKGAPQVMIMSYETWQSQFGGNPSIIGRQLGDPSSRQRITIVGIAPADLDYPAGVQFWYSLPRDSYTQVLAVARLAHGATIEEARKEFFAATSRLEPEVKLTGAKGETFTRAVAGNVQPILLVLTAAVALLLAIACINVGTLFLARASSRTGELAVRRALGASRADLVRQLFIDGALVAVAGGGAGVACASAILRGVVAVAPPDIPRISSVHLDGSVMGVAIALTTTTVLLLAFLPALAGARLTFPTSLRLGARAGTETRRRRDTRQWLVASQVGLALVMLAGTGLLGRSLLGLEHLSLGYRAEHLSVGSVTFNVDVYDSLDTVTRLSEQVIRRIQEIPGVTAATPMLLKPFTGPNIWRVPFEAEGQVPADSGTAPSWPVEIAASEYFRTLGIPILSGRPFLDTDGKDTPPVVIVNQSVARRFWPGNDPIGKRIRVAHVDCGPCRGPVFDWRTVVGVVPDTRLRAFRDTWPLVYLPTRQAFSAWQGRFAVRSTTDVSVLAPAIRSAVREIDPTTAVYGVRSMDDVLGGPLAEPRLMALLIAGFGAVALVLAAVGLYGVIASGVRERTHEIGVRMALGATPGRIRDAVLRQTLLITGVGAGVGLLAALLATRLLRALLFGVSPTDPIALGSACVVLLGAALIAAYVPARRATQIDPVRALRAE